MNHETLIYPRTTDPSNLAAQVEKLTATERPSGKPELSQG